MLKDRKIKINFLKKEEVSPHLIDLRKKEKKKIVFAPPASGFRKFVTVIGVIIFIFSITAFIWLNFLQIKNLQREISKTSFSDIEIFFEGIDAFKNFDFSLAERKFDLSEKNFSKTLGKMKETNFFIQVFIRLNPRIKTIIRLVRIFRDSSKIGVLLSKTVRELPSLFKTENKEEIKKESVIPNEILTINFLRISNFLKEKTREISTLVEGIERDFSKLNLNYLPQNFRIVFRLVKDDLPLLRKSLDDFFVFLENFKKIVGLNSFKRYLILFQNNNEIRPTGGFLGTYGQIDFEDGKIKNFEMSAGGTYDLAGQLKVRVRPPLPLLIAQPKWQFHDANWFPDWPTSAKKLIWFYEKSERPTVDGVIALNAELIPEILKITGEIPMPEYGKVFDQDNFILEVQKVIEIERKEKKKPKQILVDLTPIFIKKIFSLEHDKFSKIVEIFFKGLQEKKILFYFSDQEIQKFFQEKNWAGKIKKSPLDYLMVVVSNVNGSKTEGKISQKILYQAEIGKDGSIINTITIKRKHQGQRGEPFFGRNDLSWLRVYLPKGTIFLGAKTPTKKDLPKIEKDLILDEDLKEIEKEISIDRFSGTRITEEFGKTCFGNFLEIAPGEEKEIFFKYLLPFKLDFSKETTSYSLLVQKQSGRASEFEGEIILPERKNIVWKYPEEIRQEGEVIKFKTDLLTDKFFAFIIE